VYVLVLYCTVQKGGAFVLSLSREDFNTHLGPLQDILDHAAVKIYGRGLHSSTSQLNLRRFWSLNH